MFEEDKDDLLESWAEGLLECGRVVLVVVQVLKRPLQTFDCHIAALLNAAAQVLEVGMAEPAVLHKGNQDDAHAVLELVLHRGHLGENQLLQVAGENVGQRLVVPFDHAFQGE